MIREWVDNFARGKGVRRLCAADGSQTCDPSAAQSIADPQYEHFASLWTGIFQQCISFQVLSLHDIFYGALQFLAAVSGFDLAAHCDRHDMLFQNTFEDNSTYAAMHSSIDMRNRPSMIAMRLR